MKKKIILWMVLLIFLSSYAIADNILNATEVTTSSGGLYVLVKQFEFDNPVNVTRHEFQMRTANPSNYVRLQTLFMYSDSTNSSVINETYSASYLDFTVVNPNQSKTISSVDLYLLSQNSVGAYTQLNNVTYENVLTLSFVDPTYADGTFFSGNLTVNVSVEGDLRNITNISLYNSTDQTVLIHSEEFSNLSYQSIRWNESHINVTQYGIVYHVNVTHTDTNDDITSIARTFYYHQLIDCDNATTETEVLNFTLYHETDNTLLTGDIYVDIVTSDGLETNIIRTNVSSLALCLAGDATLTITAEVNHDVAFRNNYYIFDGEIGGGTVERISLYNYDSSTGISTFQNFLQDDEFDEIVGLIVQMERRYPPNNTWMVVQMDRTDTQGQAIFHIIEESIQYRFSYYTNNTLHITTDAFKFICDAGLCSVLYRVDTDIGVPVDDLTTIADLDNDTRILTITWTDPTSITSYVDIYITRDTLTGTTTICQQTVYSPSGSFECNLTGYTGAIITRMYSSESIDIPEFVDIKNLPGDFIHDYLPKEETYYWGFFITLVFITMGLGLGPLAVIILLLFSLVAEALLGLATVLNYGLLIVVAIVSVLISLLIRRKFI